MSLKLPRRGAYSGRLAFDSKSGFHIDPKGRRVLTEDGGKSWKYARRGDQSHTARYSQRVVPFRGTPPDSTEPHHHEVQPDDPHFDGILSDPDQIAAEITSHTAAWSNDE